MRLREKKKGRRKRGRKSRRWSRAG